MLNLVSSHLYPSAVIDLGVNELHLKEIDDSLLSIVLARPFCNASIP
jgi:hypothetical protein